MPVTEESQTAFAAFLSQSVSAGTIRSYLCAIRFYQIGAGLSDPSLLSSPRLPFLLKGIQRLSSSQPRAKRVPITPDMLLKIHSLWSTKPPSFDRTMLWAAFCLGFFGFLRSEEFTCSSPHNHSECTLTVGDIAIDSRQDPRVLTVSLRKSKTDQFGIVPIFTLEEQVMNSALSRQCWPTLQFDNRPQGHCLSSRMVLR